MLKKLFSSSIRVDVLALLLNNPDDKFYVREIAKLLQKNPSGIKRELDNLEQVEIVTSERVSNLKYFKANKKSVFYPDLRRIVLNSLGLTGSLKAVLKGSGAKSAFIYGPYASGKNSDTVDLMVIGTNNHLDNEFRDLERHFSCRLTWIEMEEKEYRARRREHEPQLASILSEKRIPLIGRV
jgi:DNA-binding transcriptional ArsR family regulator